MCLIVVKNDADASFPVEDFKNSFDRNYDGTGIAFIENGRIVIEKAMGDYKEQLEVFYRNMNRPQFVLHQRLATHGEKSVYNVHPFSVLSIDEGDPVDLIMAHNGVLSMNKFDALEKRMSDTHLFVFEYMQPLLRQYPGLIEAKAFQIMLHDYIGTSNKLAFLRSDGRSWIFNKTQGTERNGCWLSNSYSTQPKYDNYTHRHGVTNYYNETTRLALPHNQDNYNYEDGSFFRQPWNRANRIKIKSAETKTSLDADTILEAIAEYAGMPTNTLEDLIVQEPFLAYDMINFLSTDDVNEDIMNETASVIATKLYDLLQQFNKTKAA